MARPRVPAKPMNPGQLVKVEVDEVPLDETTALALQLAQSRVNEAQITLQLRQSEMERVTAALRARFEEGGKFVIQNVDFQKMVVNRREVPQGTSGQTAG